MGLFKTEDIPAMLEKSSEKEFEIHTVSELKELQTNILTNAVQVKFDEKIGDRISELHTQYDNDIHTITGRRKESNQKTYDFNKLILTELTQDQERYKVLKGEHEELKKTRGKGDSDLATEYEQFKSQALKDKEDLQQKIEDLTLSGADEKKGFAIDGVISQLKQNEAIAEDVRLSHIDGKKKWLMANTEIREGKLVLLKDGAPVLDDKYVVKEAGVFIPEQLAGILAKNKVGLGLEKDKVDVQSIILPDHVRDENSLILHMKTMPGLKMHSKEWDEMFAELRKVFKK